jgi:AcrR family transcriptional regulator
MTTAPSTPSVRERLIVAATEMVSEGTWSGVTMGKVAARAGVSRQTLYNEFGNKESLAEAIVLNELTRFLEVVEEQLDGRTPLVEALRRTCTRIFDLAQENPLLRAVLSSTHGSGAELLPYLTTQSDALLGTAVGVVGDRIRMRYPDVGLAPDQLDVAITAIVRLVLSFVMRPEKSPEEMADDLAWLATQILHKQK